MLPRLALLLYAFTVGALSAPEPVLAQPFELRDGDRVVFLGNSFFGRALEFGHIETSFALRWPERNITFRNLGWDGDTVYGHSRAGGRRRAVFGDPEEGFEKMVAHVRSLDPTVIFLAYGFNESFDGIAGVEPFRTALEHLVTQVGKETTRFVLISPIRVEVGFGTELSTSGAGGKGGSYVRRRNTILMSYRNAIAEVAREGNHLFVDLLDGLPRQDTTYTENGIHPSYSGYRKIAGAIARQLKLPPPRVGLDSDVAGEVRAAIVRKNTLYYHRWRPRNDAFVYGERKDEQKIAQTEPEKFEPFIAKQEALIRELLKDIDN